jgi:hypothetical protein
MVQMPKIVGSDPITGKQHAIEIMALYFDGTSRRMYGEIADDETWQQVREWFVDWFHSLDTLSYDDIVRWAREQASATPIT